MSRLDAIAEILRVDTDEARSFTKSVRARFESAPSYAEIQRALRSNPGGRGSVEQVVAEIKRKQLKDAAAKSPQQRGVAGARPGKRPARRKRMSEHHKERYSRKKSQ
ncbi:MAG: hypothetical protein ACYC5M_16885 [Anaerolineae bacterium]